ncbi:hypothetical protein D3C76_1570820 [compost metagenome]
MPLEELDHLRPMAQEGALALVQFGGPHLGAQVAFRCVAVLDYAFGDGQRVAWNPQPAARPGAGAAELAGLFRDHHLQAVVRGGDRGGQAGGAGADDQDVAVEGLRMCHGWIPFR